MIRKYQHSIDFATFIFMGLFPAAPFKLKPYTIVPIIVFALYKIIFLKRKLRNVKYVIISSLFFFVLTFSFIYSHDINTAKNLALRLSPFLLLPFTFSVVDKVKISSLTQVFFKTFIFSCLLYTILVLVYLLSFDALDLPKIYAHIRDKFWGFNDHPIYISFTFSIAIISVFFLKLGPSSRFFSLVILFSMVLFFARKGAIICLLLVLHFLLIKGLKKIRPPKLLFLILVIAGLFFSINHITKNHIANRFQEFSEINSIADNENTSLGSRMIVWRACTEAISKSIFFGHGIGDAQATLNIELRDNGHQKFISQKSYNKPIFKNAHNQYLQIILSSGIIGFVLFILFYIWLFTQPKISKNTFATGIFVFILLCFSFESFLERQNGIMLIAILINIFLFGSTYRNNNRYIINV